MNEYRGSIAWLRRQSSGSRVAQGPALALRNHRSRPFSRSRVVPSPPRYRRSGPFEMPLGFVIRGAQALPYAVWEAYREGGDNARDPATLRRALGRRKPKAGTPRTPGAVAWPSGPNGGGSRGCRSRITLVHRAIGVAVPQVHFSGSMTLRGWGESRSRGVSEGADARNGRSPTRRLSYNP